ncbi:MAG: BatA and WFA domain-containing protein [Pirellulaceae bacterium]
MSWFNSVLNPLGWTLLLVVPPLIVLLYFLKLRRRPIQVPSTYLWKKAIEDMHVNSLWQRLRNNLLMFLQILAVLLIALACLRPGCEGTELSGERFIFLVDNSASMSATDVDSGSRLDEAKRQVGIMIDRMKPGDVAMLMVFSNKAEVFQGFTVNQNLLKQKLGEIEQSHRPTDVREALNAAAGLANPGRTSTDAGDVQIADALPSTLMIFSDGGFENVNDFSLGNLTPEYHAIGGLLPPVNVGITALAINNDPNISDRREAFAQLTNSSMEDQSVSATLFVEDEVFDAQDNVVIPAGRSVGISFPLTALFAQLDTATQLKLVVSPDDDMTEDNVAFTVVNPPRLAQVLIVTPGNEYLELAMDTEPIQKMASVVFESRDYITTEEYRTKAFDGEFDLVIFDQCQPETMPNCNTMFLGDKPPGDDWKFGDKQYPTPIADFFRSHPLINSMQLTNITILEAAKIEGPSGTQSLIDSTYGTIMAIGPRGGFQDLVCSFPLATFTDDGFQVNTDWPSKLSFPLFVQNLVSNLAGGARFLTQDSASPGEIARISPPPTVSRVQIINPQETQFSQSRDKNNMIQFSQTELPGVYTVAPDEFSTETAPPIQYFAVNLFDPQESNINVREELEIGFEPVAATTEVLPARTEYWKWIILLVLAVIIAEWYIYNRRILI